MSELDLTAIKLLFLFGFTIHNIEEAIWLPKWSRYAKKFHEPVGSNKFIFAVMVVTIGTRTPKQEHGHPRIGKKSYPNSGSFPTG